jgi:hypothetical protein
MVVGGAGTSNFSYGFCWIKQDPSAPANSCLQVLKHMNGTGWASTTAMATASAFLWMFSMVQSPQI